MDSVLEDTVCALVSRGPAAAAAPMPHRETIDTLYRMIRYTVLEYFGVVLRQVLQSGCGSLFNIGTCNRLHRTRYVQPARLYPLPIASSHVHPMNVARSSAHISVLISLLGTIHSVCMLGRSARVVVIYKYKRAPIFCNRAKTFEGYNVRFIWGG